MERALLYPEGWKRVTSALQEKVISLTKFQALKLPFEVQVLETESQSSILRGRALALQMDQCNHYRSRLLVIKVDFYKMMNSSHVPVAGRHALECASVQQL